MSVCVLGCHSDSACIVLKACLKKEKKKRNENDKVSHAALSLRVSIIGVNGSFSIKKKQISKLKHEECTVSRLS